MQTITERYGKKRLTIFFVCCFAIIGVVGFNKINEDAGPPTCAHHWGSMTRASTLDCMDAVIKWCAENHPEDPDGCSSAIDVDGDDRNVGKE
ncbi:hypothetical protein [Streptomyces sp. NPDC001422]|uniref:hypothetical protein n=1 Tax=Streptomyces sp. NPDC001422 TaxID=3364575 RepID=UPI0036AB2883